MRDPARAPAPDDVLATDRSWRKVTERPKPGRVTYRDGSGITRTCNLSAWGKWAKNATIVRRGAFPPERPPAVQWPFSGGSSVTVERNFAAWMLRQTRKESRVAGYKQRAHYLAANGRQFKWPVRGEDAAP